MDILQHLCRYFLVPLCHCLFSCSFEQEVLGGPVPVAGSPVMEPMPVALAVPLVRPIIGTNTYRQVCVFSLITFKILYGLLQLNKNMRPLTNKKS